MSESTSGLEDIFIKCPDCGHSAADHNQERFGPLCTGNDFKPDATACDCQRTYESIVNTINEPELQLLVIDLGDSCVVKVEKGVMPRTSNNIYKDLGFFGKQSIVHVTFDRFREAIDQKPVPRIERNDPVGYRFISGSQPADGGHIWLSQEYDALTKLAGKPLPVWEGGKWEQLIPFTLSDMYSGWSPLTSTQIDGGTGVAIWRFTQ